MSLNKLLILIILFFANFTYSQKFTLQEMIDLNHKNVDDFDTYVVSKGYDFNKFNEEDNYDSKSYSFKGFNEDSAEFWITKNNYYLKGFYKKGSVSWVTSNKNYYLSIKEQIKKLGFTFLKTENENGNLSYNYEKGKISISIYSVRRPNAFGKIGTVYEINVGLLN